MSRSHYLVFLFLLFSSSVFAQSKKSAPKSNGKSNAAPIITDGYTRPKLSIARAYHDITCHFNYWFNANLKLDESIQSVKESSTDDYTQILPLYEYDNEAALAGLSSTMDEVIKKASMGIQLHEKSVWTQDCYLAMGKAYYFKRSYDDALETFQYIQTKYKIKTIKGIPIPQKWYEHKLKTNQGLMWLIKTYIMMGKFDEAEAIVKDIQARKGFPIEYKEQLGLLHTLVLIKKKDYIGAVSPLAQVIKITKKPALKVRYTYILAQLYEFGNDNKNAIAVYRQVIAMKPDFVMDFHARMKMVELYSELPNLPATEIRGILLAMLSDSKYSDYYDQIYYRLAELELRNKNEKMGIQYLRLSIAASTNNLEQKGLSNKRLADIYWENPKYILAKNRYDSAYQYLPATNEYYPIVRERKEILEEVVKRIKIIQLEDSLQKLAALNPQELQKKLSKDLERQKAKAMEDSLNKAVSNKANTENKISENEASATFYFYNPGMKANGYNDFIKKWGNRPLADDWRRSRKNQKSFSSTPTDVNDSKEDEKKNSAEEKSKTGNPELDKALASIPLTEKQMQASTDRIVDAYYELGYLYKDRVKNEKKAIETFEKLLSKYPKNKFQVETYYILYLMYEEVKNFAQSSKYKSKILNEYPTSKFAAMLKDPNYQKKEDAKKNEVFTYYNKTFEYFQGQAYQEVIDRVGTAMESFKPNPIEAKYALLKAIATGGLGDVNNYNTELNNVIKSYPNTPEKKKAEELLAAIRDFGKEKPKVADNTNNSKADNNKINGKTSDTNTNAAGASGGSFEYDPSIEHYFVVVFKSLNPKAAAGLGNVSNFINKNHSLDNLIVTTQMLGMNSQMAIVKSFPNADKASEFLDEVDEQASQLFKGLSNAEYYTMIITQHNLEEMNKLGYSNSYQTFYEEKYFGEQ